MIFSPDGHCRPFDEKARGTRGGSGAGVVVLKRLADAVADRDTIHAVILGAGDQQRRRREGRLHRAERRRTGRSDRHGAGARPASIRARSATSRRTAPRTPLGDPIEIAALTQAFRASTNDVGFCRLGSLKANLGHLDAAAGVAGLIKTVLRSSTASFRRSSISRAPNPQLVARYEPVRRECDARRRGRRRRAAPRRAGVSSFGIGGTNAHVVLEEAPTVRATDAVARCASARAVGPQRGRARSHDGELARSSRVAPRTCRSPTWSTRSRSAGRTSRTGARSSCAIVLTRSTSFASQQRAPVDERYLRRRCAGRSRSSSAAREASTSAWARMCTNRAASIAKRSTAARSCSSRTWASIFATSSSRAAGDTDDQRDALHPARAVRDRVRARVALDGARRSRPRPCSVTASASTSRRTSPA